MGKVQLKRNVWFRDKNGIIIHMFKKDDIIDCRINKKEGIYETRYGSIHPQNIKIIIEGRNV